MAAVSVEEQVVDGGGQVVGGLGVAPRSPEAVGELAQAQPARGPGRAVGVAHHPREDAAQVVALDQEAFVHVKLAQGHLRLQDQPPHRLGGTRPTRAEAPSGSP